MYDIVVCGGGSAGFATALHSAAKGAKVALIEQFGQLGGILTSSCLGYIMDAEDKSEVLVNIKRIFNATEKSFNFDMEKMKFYLENELIKVNVDILYFSKISGVSKKDNYIEYVETQTKSGGERIYGKIFVDCTGDGDVGFFSGCSYDLGIDGKTQPLSYNFIVNGINFKDVSKFIVNSPNAEPEDGKKNLLAEFAKAGFVPSYVKPTLFSLENEIYFLGINHQYLDGTKAKDLTKSIIEGRKEAFMAVESLKSLGGIWKDLAIIQTPTYVGVREGRRLRGEYTVTKEDLINGTAHEDSVCHVTFNVDIHDKSGYTNADIKTKPYDIPLGSLKSKDIKNLYMAGRCISGDFYAHASYRVAGNTFTMGENLGKYLANQIKVEL